LRAEIPRVCLSNTSRLIPSTPAPLSWQGEVIFDGVEVPAGALLGDRENIGWAALTRAMERALPVLCAYQVGSCQAAFEMSVQYSNTRVQFAFPIGRFQRSGPSPAGEACGPG